MSTTKEQQLSFAEHLGELRKRIVRSGIVLAVITIVAFFFSEPVAQLLQRPLQDKLYYFTPAGGFSFTVQVALMVGVIFALPVVVYHVIKFVSPAFNAVRWKHIASYFGLSIILALAGVAFAYFVSLPPALRILRSLSPDGVNALIGAEDYMKFVLIYLAGYALLFQLPLIVNFIDRVKPLKPSKLNKYQRHAVAGSFIVAAILTPTPDVFNQAIFALPMILLFELSLGIIVIKHFKRQRKQKAVVQPVPQVSEPALPSIFYPDNWNHELGMVEEAVAVAEEAQGTQPTYVSGFDIGRPSMA